MQFDEGYSTRCLLYIGGRLSVDLYSPVCELSNLVSTTLSASYAPVAPAVPPQALPPPQSRRKVSLNNHLLRTAEEPVFQSSRLSGKGSHCTRALLKAWLATARTRISRAKSEPEPETSREIKACLLWNILRHYLYVRAWPFSACTELPSPLPTLLPRTRNLK